MSAVTAPRKSALLEELAREEARLVDFDRQREAVRTRVETLRAELRALSTSEPANLTLPLATSTRVPTTPAEKMKLFRALFRGREDVFPTRFVSKRTGQAGYARGEAPLGYAEAIDEPTVEYDEETLRHFEEAT